MCRISPDPHNCLWDIGIRGVVISLFQMRGLGPREVKLFSKGRKGSIELELVLCCFSCSKTPVPLPADCVKEYCRWLKKTTPEEGFVNLALILQYSTQTKTKIQIYKCAMQNKMSESTNPIFYVKHFGCLWYIPKSKWQEFKGNSEDLSEI